MKIGVISDTHGSLPDKVKDRLESCDFLIHAGDVGSQECYRAIIDLHVPSYLVKGNCDRGNYATFMPENLSFHIDGIPCYLIHDQNKLPILLPEETKLVIFGHTHHYTLFERQGRTYLNPGSISDGRGDAKSFVILETKAGGFQAKRFTL